MNTEKNLFAYKVFEKFVLNCKHFSYGTDFVDLLNKALFKKLVQGSPSTLPDPNVQSKLMKGKSVRDP